MADVVLFHYLQGLTDGVRAFAAELRASGHTVHTPDLFEGSRPQTIDDGVALVGDIGDGVALVGDIGDDAQSPARPGCSAEATLSFAMTCPLHVEVILGSFRLRPQGGVTVL
jgi:hypothetical protein